MTRSIERHLKRRAAQVSALAIAGLAIAAPAFGQTAHILHIPAGPLDAALLALAAQSHEQLLYTPSLVAGRTSPAVDGELTAEQALARMLATPDILVARTGPSVVVLRAAPNGRTVPAAMRPTPALGEPLGARPFGVDAGSPTSVQYMATDKADPGSGPTNTVSEVEVTGSHIRGAPPASPLLVISRDDLERSGQTTLADALRVLPQNFNGGASEGTETTGADRVGRNTAFGTALNLRGLGNDATLVLIDGRRVAGSGTFGDFTDISTIPTAAVERVEVLLDGASALYGSDAVGGVVNIIMRKNFDGAETRLLAGVGTSGQPGQEQVSQTLGKRWSGGGVVFTYELQNRDHLAAADRDFAASADLRPLGGTDLRLTSSFPGNIVVGSTPTFAIPAGQNGVGLTPGQLTSRALNLQNQRQGEDLLPRQTLNAVYLAADQAIGDRLQISGDARYSLRDYHVVLAPSIANLTVNTKNPFFVSPTGATSETIAYSFVGDLPNPVSQGSVETLAFSLDGTLKLFGDWQTRGYVTYAQEFDDVRGHNLVNSLALSQALGTVATPAGAAFNPAQSGFFNPFTGIAGSNPSAVTAFIGSGATGARSRDAVSSLSLQADGTVWTLPGGPLKLAVGAQSRRETLVRTGFNLLSTATPSPIPATDVARTVNAAFAEALIPLVGPQNALPGIRRLELTVAGRVESYSDVGTTSNPKVGLVWGPTDDLQIRGTYGTSFRAPALDELADSAIFAPTLLPLGAARIRTLILLGGNPNLQPETAKSWTVGADFKPKRWPGLTLGITGFDVRFRNRVDRPVSQNLVGALTDPTLASFVTRISPATNPADLALITSLLNNPALTTANGVFLPTDYGTIADDRYVNTTTLHVQGLDFAGADLIPLGEDRLTLAVNATYMLTYDQQFTPTSALANDLNVANFPVRVRSRATADWTRGRITLGAAFNYVGAYHDSLGTRIGDQPTFDVQARLAPPDSGLMRGISVLFSVRNIFDRAPPFYNNPIGLGYDAANADVIGRFASVQLTRVW